MQSGGDWFKTDMDFAERRRKSLAAVKLQHCKPAPVASSLVAKKKGKFKLDYCLTG